MSYIFINKCYNDSVKSSIKLNWNKFIKYIHEYVDRNYNAFFNSEFNKPYWNTGSYVTDSKIIFETVGLKEKDLDDVIKETNVTNSSWIVYNKNYYWALILIIKYFQENKNYEAMNLTVLYLSMIMYTGLHHKYFRGIPVNPNCMQYTINNLNNRYDIKKYGTIIKTIQKIALTCHDTYKNKFEKDSKIDDLFIKDYLCQYYTRLNNFLKGIKDQYTKNLNSKKYLNSEADDYSQDNFYESDSTSQQIERMANKITNTITSSNINYSLAEISAKLASVSVNEVKVTIRSIIEQEAKEIKEYIGILLYEYLIVDGHPIETIYSKNYLPYINKIYTKSNTNDKSIIRMKNLLDSWLKKYSEKYLKTERLATLNNFRKSLHLYFSLSIQSVLTNKY